MQSLQGQFLIAMPSMDDDRFARSVIFIIEHGEEGAMGIMINKQLDLSFEDVLIDLDMAQVDEDNLSNLPVWDGGPVDRVRGFVLHTSDYFVQGASMKVRSDIVLSGSRDILNAIAQQKENPQKSLFALGYAGWSAGQLEQELAANMWLTVDATPDILFGVEAQDRYEQSLGLLGLTAANLSPLGGSA